MVHGVALQDQAEPVARATKFDIAGARQPARRRRVWRLPNASRHSGLVRLLVVTSREPDGAPLEWLFDVYVVKPCPLEALIEAIRSVPIPPPTTQDLLIVARDRVGIDDVLQRLGDAAANVEIRLDCRRGERRGERRRVLPALKALERRRRADRRALDVSHQLQMEGGVFIPAIHRS